MRMQAPSSTAHSFGCACAMLPHASASPGAGLSCAADGASTSHAASDAQSAHTDSDSSTVEIPTEHTQRPARRLVYCTCAPLCTLHVASSRAYCERYVARLVAEARCIGARCVSRIAVPHQPHFAVDVPSRRHAQAEVNRTIILGYRRYAQKPVAIAGRVFRVGRRLISRRRPRAATRFRRRRRLRAGLHQRPRQRDVGRGDVSIHVRPRGLAAKSGSADGNGRSGGCSPRASAAAAAVGDRRRGARRALALKEERCASRRATFRGRNFLNHRREPRAAPRCGVA